MRTEPCYQSHVLGPAVLGVLGLAALGDAPPSATSTGAADRSDRPVRLWVDAATDFPIHVGGRVTLEGWHRLRLWTSLGVLPTPYVEVIDGIAQALGGYDDATGELVVSSLERSLVWRIHGGWRPFSDLGLTVDVGYTLATLGGNTSTSELLSAALGRSVDFDRGAAYQLDATVHQLGVEVGWRWPLGAGVSLRTAVGFVGTIDSSTQAIPNDPLPRSVALGDELAAYLDGIFTSYVHFPYIALSVGYGLHELF